MPPPAFKLIATGRKGRWLGVLLATVAIGHPSIASGQNVPGIKYADQPTGIKLVEYAAAWPALSPYLQRLQAAHGTEVLADLRSRASVSGVTDGELNLLAQLAWQHGDLATADRAIAQAVAMRPKEPAHVFQQAMVCFAHLRLASGLMERWKWQRQTRDAYQRTFDLDPRNIPARYYLAYTYLNTPAIGGGDKEKALKLSEEGIAFGQDEFFAVRADVHRVRDEYEAACADYDTAIERRVIKLGGLLEAGAEALARREWPRAKRYFEWAVYCRADSAGAHEGLGDYFVAINDLPAAGSSFETALQKNPNLASAREKLAKLHQHSP